MSPDRRTVVVIGAAGEMAGTLIRVLARMRPEVSLILADVNVAKLDELVSELSLERAEARHVDLFDAVSLDAVVRGASLVVNGAGPFMRTAQPVIESCIANAVDYLDYDDDHASTAAAIELEQRLADAGISCFKNCGHSPGMTNVLARDVVERLDEVESLDVCWALGDEGPHVYGRAVIEHWLDVIEGPVPTWREGPVMAEAFAASDVYPLAGELGRFRLYEVGHPEPLTLPRRYPDIPSIRCMGGLHPQPVNGLSVGIARAVSSGRLTLEEAIDWARLVFNDQNGPLKVWRPATAGMIRQVRRGHVGLRELAAFVWHAVRGRHEPWRGAAAAYAVGHLDGEQVVALRRTPAAGPGSSLWTSLAMCTGHNAAAFCHLALERSPSEGRGLLFPEDWVSPSELYRALELTGVRPEDVVDPFIVARSPDEIEN